MTPKPLISSLDPIHSRIISLLKCGLTVIVVLIHTYIDTGSSNTLYAQTYGWVRNVLFLSNSMFFLLSGYLFFHGCTDFSWSWYGGKLRRRLSSLLVPYLLWNTILLLILSLGVVFVPSLRGDYFIPLQEMTPSGLFRTYFCLYRDNPSCPPLDGPFWFLRDLMFLCLVTPLFWLLSRLGGWSLLVVLLAILLPFPSMSVIYFYVGAYMAIRRVRLKPYCQGHFLISLSLFVLLMCILRYVAMPEFLNGVLHALMSLAGMVALAHIAHRAIQRWPQIPSAIVQGSIFILFAFHIVVARVLTKISLTLLQFFALTSWAYFLMHIINALLCIVLCFALYLLLRRFTPRLCRTLGARTALIALLFTLSSQCPVFALTDGETAPDTTHLAELPLFELTYDASAFNSKSFIPAQLTFHTADTIKHYTCTLRRRGGTALAYSKPNYAIKFYDEAGEPRDVKFLGMRKDNNWILDGMASDFSRMRNRVSMDLWLAYSHAPFHQELEPKAVNGYRGHYVEVCANGEYMGLFCLSERVDRKQLKIKKPTASAEDSTLMQYRGLMYKAISSSSTRTPFFLWQQVAPNNAKSYYDGLQCEYPDVNEGEPWDWNPLRDNIYYLVTRYYKTLTEKLGQYFDLLVFNDYVLLLDLLKASDNVGKNYYCWFYDWTTDHRLCITPWDLDATWGRDCIGGRSAATELLTNKSEYHRRLSAYYYSYADSLQTRYAELRDSHWREDSLTARFDQYFDLFGRTGAWERDSARWVATNCKIRGLEEERQYIHTWIHDRLKALDEYYSYQPDAVPIDTLPAVIRTLRIAPSVSRRTRFDLFGRPIQGTHHAAISF